MVAEILAGAALVKASIESIKGVVKTAKDISALTKDIDNLFAGAHQLKQQENEAKRTAPNLSLIHIPSPRDGLLSRMPSSA